jgi:hypothetical protein
MAMIARAFIRLDPFEVWGPGEQLRNWTYVSDIVAGTLAATEHASDGEAFNIGSMEGTRVLDAVRMILDRANFSAEIVTRPEMPTGPYYRIADNTKLARASGWSRSVFRGRSGEDNGLVLRREVDAGDPRDVAGTASRTLNTGERLCAGSRASTRNARTPRRPGSCTYNREVKASP